MKNLTIRRITERGEWLLRAAQREQWRMGYEICCSRTWQRAVVRRNRFIRTPARDRYKRYLRYRRNLKRLGIKPTGAKGGDVE